MGVKAKVEVGVVGERKGKDQSGNFEPPARRQVPRNRLGVARSLDFQFVGVTSLFWKFPTFCSNKEQRTPLLLSLPLCLGAPGKFAQGTVMKGKRGRYLRASGLVDLFY